MLSCPSQDLYRKVVCISIMSYNQSQVNFVSFQLQIFCANTK